MTSQNNVVVKEQDVMKAAQDGMDSFIKVFTDAALNAVGGELNQEAFTILNADQISLLGYVMLRDEVLDGGFVQLIHNGYGPFFFDNPFAKAMRLMGLKDFSKLLYKVRELYMLHKQELTKDCSDEEFMALFEQFDEFDELDDEYVEMEEEWTETLAHYVDEHIEQFAVIEK